MNCGADDILNALKKIMYLPTAYKHFHLILFLIEQMLKNIKSQFISSQK